MKILYITYHGFSEHSGISKKMLYQIDGLRQLGHDVSVCQYYVRADGHRIREIDGEVINDYGTGCLSALKKRICYGKIVEWAVKHGVEFVYIRSFHNANPFTIRLFKALKKHGIRLVQEIPTYPYDHEYKGFPLRQRLGIYIDKVFRRALAAQTDGIVTFTDDEKIFGQRTIRISNGIDFKSIPVRPTPLFPPQGGLSATETSPEGRLEGSKDERVTNIIAVAEVHPWHGLDRMIDAIGRHYQQMKTSPLRGGMRGAVLHIVGYCGPDVLPRFQELISLYNIADKIVFHGPQYGDALDALFADADWAVGSLARHRSGITNIKTLKNREYAARGLRFIYSETDTDFDHQPYIYKVSDDENPIDLQQVMDAMDTITMSPEDIRSSIQHLSWTEQMRKVIDQFA